MKTLLPAVLLALALFAVSASAQFIGGMSGVGGGLGLRSGGGAAPTTCTGTIDLSEGCTLTVAIGIGP